MSNRLNGRVALVTGASSGIGEATALELARQGARVAVAARRRDRLDTLAKQLDALGAAPLVLPADLADEAAAQRVVKETEAHYGRLDVLVNNAGVMYLEPVAEADLGRWRHMLELNLLGLIAATQAALAGMRARRDGHIVNIASTAGRVANPNAGGYAATKFGVVAFSEALRREAYKDNIRVSVIEPGAVATELREHIGHAAVRDATNAWAEGMRQLQSQDVAEVIAFCVSRPPHVNVNEVLLRPTDQER
ncbi:SDR family NAD(P)-dependent oxidoreductase [Fulvimonas soli]|jgi:NADP-dependent 3-hydroxy acid dehydrogenase YdfG|uniref:NADP-dependent 3-hydroxy acid dehydrogenase YdfG n=1 Tax=Fulvimonas soli TaxID=155197 RepID=A0A316I5G2_9GAMM|nr:SDR family NAD(P)-dependent oxidoreductase [Fulvimonas soli]PWK87613.1 NADP-dependent 3-hydroxy acid dehydrogenase YdfG [Fulvimonas soli]TNY25799.1 oxidoreductase [Fulvimonas soli]